MTANNSPTVQSPTICSGSQLNIPLQERLLPVGPHSREINMIVEKVKHALGITCHQQTPSMQITNVKIQESINHHQKLSFRH